jgi:hypothetical protein
MRRVTAEQYFFATGSGRPVSHFEARGRLAVNTMTVRPEAKIWLEIEVHASRMKAASHAEELKVDVI